MPKPKNRASWSGPYSASLGPGSSAASIDLGHGQTIDYANINGVITLFSTTTDGRGVSVCELPSDILTNGWLPVNYRSYTLQPAEVAAGTVSISLDKSLLIKTGGPYLGGKNIRMCRLRDLLALPPGDYSSRVGSLLSERMQPASSYANQGATFDGNYLWLFNGNNLTTDPKELTLIRWADGKVYGPYAVTPGLKLAKALAGGAGDVYEPEGLFIVVTGPGQKPQLWCTIATRDVAGTGYAMFALPIFQGDFGAQPMNGNKSPFGIGANFAGGGRKASWPEDETFSWGTYATYVTGATIGTVVKLVAAWKAFVGEAVKFSVYDETSATERQVFEIDRSTGVMSWILAPLKIGGSIPAVGAAGAILDSAGRWVMSLASDGAAHFLFRSNTNNAGAISSSGTITTYKTTAAGAGLTAYAGTPEGDVSAAPGCICADITNGVIYVKKTGTGNTGWKLVTQAA